jgi:hypothetical protein
MPCARAAPHGPHGLRSWLAGARSAQPLYTTAMVEAGRRHSGGGRAAPAWARSAAVQAAGDARQRERRSTG